MKKLFLCAALAVCSFASVDAQEVSFGVTAGFLSGDAKVEYGGEEISYSDSGFYFGGVADIGISEEFHIQPELLYATIDGSSALMLPIMAKYYVAEGFNIQAGPQFVFSLEETGDDYSSIEIDLGIGVGYDINENFFIEARYALQLNNSYTGDEDLTAKANYINVGVGYNF
ncbi:porin family protein [Winogradskyella psychrotolerans]|uniref:porin family protein n=1 Tax=Winogradskyella psychrotolerans TaxID=1344585 RepID=UPI001C072EB3|nr:porin family protein [Winogradskyella psychrotolerans]MBU2927241.1 PorT family protein [Winogradskyella psychrotolerans]